MSIVNDGTIVPKALVDRVKGILLTPKTEWSLIELEPATPKTLFIGYACILAAIPPICSLIGGQVFGHGALGIVFHPPLVTAVVGAIVAYAMSLVMVFVMAMIINALATSFDGQKSHIQALKVAVYSYTATWVAGVLGLIPALLPLAIIAGLYGFYLLYLGLPKLMKVPQEKAVGYIVVSVIVAIILSIVIGAVTAALVGMSALSAGGLASISGRSADNGRISGSVGVPGVGSVDLGKLQDASKQMEAAAKQMQASAAGSAGSESKVIPADVLQAMLPTSLAGFVRGEVSSQSGGAAGIAGSSAEGHYAKGDANITLQVTDLGTMAGLATMGSALNVNSNKQTSTGYEKMGKVDGRMTTEEWDSQSKSGKYGVTVGNRFMVEAEGSGLGIDELKSAVHAIDFGKLEGLARS